MALLLQAHVSSAATPAPAWEWVKLIGGTTYTESLDIATARTGTIFIGSRMYEGNLGTKSFPDIPQHVLGVFDTNGSFLSATSVFAKGYYSSLGPFQMSPFSTTLV
jgi:hypothetical protein